MQTFALPRSYTQGTTPIAFHPYTLSFVPTGAGPVTIDIADYGGYPLAVDEVFGHYCARAVHLGASGGG